MSPMTAMNVAAVVTLTPGMVMSRWMSSVSRAWTAMSRSTSASSAFKKSTCRRQASTVWRSSMVSSSCDSHLRLFLPKRSVAGGALEVAVHNRVDLVLGLGALLDELSSSRDAAPQHSGRLVAGPHLREKARGEKLDQRASVDLVGLD